MLKRVKEIGRFNNGGKSFFFNEAETPAGHKCIEINAMFGRKGFQSITVFRNQMLDFHALMAESMKEIFGVNVSEVQVESPKCPGCEAHTVLDHGVLNVVVEDRRLTCDECGYIYYDGQKQ